jgi:hypothetical protein
METKAKKMLPEIRLVKDKSLLSITTIKKKHLEQMQRVTVEQVESFGGEVIGWFGMSTFDHVVIRKFEDYFRCEIWVLATAIAKDKFSELYDYKDLPEKDYRLRFKEQEEVIKKEIEILKRKCTQLFVE